MRTYRITELKNDNDGLVHVIGKRGKYSLDINVPVSFGDRLKVGKKITEYMDPDFELIGAYSSGANIHVNFYTDSIWIAKLGLGYIKGIREGSLDKLRFKFTLIITMLNYRMVPTLFASYNLFLLEERQSKKRLKQWKQERKGR